MLAWLDMNIVLKPLSLYTKQMGHLLVTFFVMGAFIFSINFASAKPMAECAAMIKTMASSHNTAQEHHQKNKKMADATCCLSNCISIALLDNFVKVQTMSSYKIVANLSVIYSDYRLQPKPRPPWSYFS